MVEQISDDATLSVTLGANAFDDISRVSVRVWNPDMKQGLENQAIHIAQSPEEANAMLRKVMMRLNVYGQG